MVQSILGETNATKVFIFNKQRNLFICCVLIESHMLTEHIQSHY